MTPSGTLDRRGVVSDTGAAVCVCALLVLAACSAATPQAAPSVPALQWREPADYAYRLVATCGERSFFGSYRIEVRDHAVGDVTTLDEAAVRAMEGYDATDEAPTLADLLDELRTARAGGADVATVASDPDDGHPTAIRIDGDADTLDDEACYDIVDYAPLR